MDSVNIGLLYSSKFSISLFFPEKKQIKYTKIIPELKSLRSH